MVFAKTVTIRWEVNEPPADKTTIRSISDQENEHASRKASMEAKN